MTLVERAAKIAAAANECCTRSDGYEEDIAALALTEITAAVGEALAGALEVEGVLFGVPLSDWRLIHHETIKRGHRNPVDWIMSGRGPSAAR